MHSLPLPILGDRPEAELISEDYSCYRAFALVDVAREAVASAYITQFFLFKGQAGNARASYRLCRPLRSSTGRDMKRP